jgi:valine dehydrogenase (NAD+)
MVCGGANNQLAHPGIEKRSPSGACCTQPVDVVPTPGRDPVSDELRGFSFDRAHARATRIFDTTTQVLELAAAEGLPPVVAADRLAEERMRSVGRLSGALRCGGPRAAAG